MAGTLVTSTIQGSTLSDGTNSTSTTNCIKGSAKAWVSFSGSTVNASYNVSSITVNGTGDYTVTFTSAFSDTNYSFCGFADSNSLTRGGGGTKTTTSCNLVTTNGNGSALVNPSTVYAVAFR